MRPVLTLLWLLLLLGCGGEKLPQSGSTEDVLVDAEEPDALSSSDVNADPADSDAGDALTREEDGTVTHEDVSPPNDSLVSPDGLSGGLDADETEEIPWGSEQCPEAPEGVSPGYAVGDQLEAMSFNTCEGTPYAVNSTCGAAATWIFMAHAWCGDCQQVASFSEDVVAYFEEHNVAVVHVLVHSPLESLPVAQDCIDWKTLWGLETTTLVYDPWFASVLLADTGQTAQSVLLDANRVIVDKLHTADEAELIGAIQTILTP